MRISKKEILKLTWLKLNNGLKENPSILTKKDTQTVVDTYTRVLADMLAKGNDVALGKELGILKLKPYEIRAGRIGNSFYESLVGKRVKFNISNNLKISLRKLK